MGRGRPAVCKPKRIIRTFRLDVEDDRILTLWCREHGVTLTEAIRAWIGTMREEPIY